jgi:catechol 2,3-dioxygenase-like lactoylglutathione lyase family enzyme
MASRIVGNHHITLSTGGAQEDWDFHTQTLGLRPVKKTMLYDGTEPVYHVYYANADGGRTRSRRSGSPLTRARSTTGQTVSTSSGSRPTTPRRSARSD